MKQLFEWIDNRTGIRGLLHEALYEPVPGGSRWRYVTGSMLVMCFVTQAITGILLWMSYSPGAQNAWESVYAIQFQITGGWFLRGIHHFTAHAMVVLLPIHLLQVVVDRAYVAPREFNYWLGLVLMLIVMALGLTGYLLPWDQKGYWATKVATNLIGLSPGGAYIRKIVVGGSDYGQYTLTHFFALHAGILPALLVIVLIGHLALFRKHGIKAYRPELGNDEFFWPYQVWKDSLAFFVLLVVICGFVWWEGGAEFGAPADPTEAYKAARPEWYFLFLFQLLKKFKSEFVGAIVVPGLMMLFLFALPIIGRKRIGHRLNVGMIVLLICGAVYLTGEAMYDDRYSEWYSAPGAKGSKKAQQLYSDSKEYLDSVEIGETESHRAQILAQEFGIPKEGMLSRLRVDSEIMGARLFRERCASCHAYRDSSGKGFGGLAAAEGDATEDNSAPLGAPNLYGFGSRAWLTGFLHPEKIVSSDYFGDTAHGQKDADGDYPSGGMVAYVHENLAELDETGKKSLQDVVVALSAEAGLVQQKGADEQARQDGTIPRGIDAFQNTFKCSDCHRLGESGGTDTAPDLTGWSSEKWLIGMISNPIHESFYQETNDRMPGFATSEDPDKNLLTPDQIRFIARWLRQDDVVLP
ncbi:MAG: cytochrome b N-terminal domain-containing protein [Planctomycetota bacterium]|nr:cytochrome b N-terminal domain-containing protein [Planctomycetota bacterium]MDA1179636.1 cytochrome b N-terminal domain-containing protein [Planctomycetota bacterium]